MGNGERYFTILLWFNYLAAGQYYFKSCGEMRKKSVYVVGKLKALLTAGPAGCYTIYNNPCTYYCDYSDTPCSPQAKMLFQFISHFIP
jgi:hypothetical protein